MLLSPSHHTAQQVALLLLPFTTLPLSARQANSHSSKAEEAKVASCQCSVLASLPTTQGLDDMGHIHASAAPVPTPAYHSSASTSWWVS